MPRFNKADLRYIEDLFIDHDYLEEKDDGDAERASGEDADTPDTQHPKTRRTTV